MNIGTGYLFIPLCLCHIHKQRSLSSLYQLRNEPPSILFQVLLDGPCTGVPRQAYRLKNLHLTPLTIKIAFSTRSKNVRTAWETEGITKKWEESAWAKRMAAKARRAGLNDFERFQLMKAKSARNKILAKATNTQKKKQKL